MSANKHPLSTMTSLIVILILLFAQQSHQKQVISNEKELAVLRDQWYDLSHKVDDVIWPLKARFISLLNHITTDSAAKYSESCRRSLNDLKDGLVSGTRESHMLFDSFTKTHPGALGERMFDMGAYDQCLSSKFYSSPARYVMFHLMIPMPVMDKEFQYHDEQDSWMAEMSKKMSAIKTAQYPIAVCLPSSCSEGDIVRIIKSEYMTNLTSPAYLVFASSETLADAIVPQRIWLQLISRTILSVIIGTVVVSTLVNYCNPAYGFLKPFDAVANTAKLFADGRSENKNLGFLNGIRALYLLLNIPSHIAIPHIETNFFWNMIVFRNSRTFSDYTKLYVMTAGHYVSSNVVVASCLSTIGWMPELSKNSEKNSNGRSRGPGFLSYVMLRALRTLPVMIAFILITFTFPIIGHSGGPLMKQMQQTLSEKCFQHGWKDILFMSNFGSFHEMCMPVGWFMSADFQLYVIAFVYLKMLNTRPRVAFSLIAAQVIAGILIHAWYLDHVNVPSLLKLWTWDGYNNLHGYIKLFAHTFNYIAIYPIGVILGYCIVKGYKIEAKNRGLVFALLAGASQAALFSPAVFYDDLEFKFGGVTHRRLGEIMFGSLHRVVFVSLYAACCLFLHSHPDFWLSKLLSHKPLVVLSRFSYSAFMAHPLVIMFMLSSMPDMNMNSTFLQMMCLYAVVLSLLIGYLFFIFFEAPAMNLLKSWASDTKIRSISMIEEKSTTNEANNNHHYNLNQKQK